MPGSAPGSSSGSATPRSKAAIAIALGVISATGPLAVHLYLPVMPAVRGAFEVSEAVAQFSFSLSLFTMAFMTLAYGSLSDRLGRRPVLLGGLVLFTFGSGLALLAHSIEILMIARFLQAAGAACGLVLSRAIARDVFGADRLVKVIAYLTMAYTLMPMIAPPIGGWLVDHYGWRSIFWFATLCGAAILASSFLVLGESRPGGGGQATGVNLLRDFPSLFSDLRYAAFMAQTGLASGTFFTLVSGSAFLMRDILDRPAVEFGLYFFAFSFGYWLGNLISTRLSGRIPSEVMVLAGSLILFASAMTVTILLALGIHSPLSLFLPGFFLTLSQGLSLPNAQAAAINIFPSRSGTSAGIGVFMQMVCAALFSQIFGLFYQKSPEPLMIILAIGASGTLAAAILAMAATRKAALRG